MNASMCAELAGVAARSADDFLNHMVEVGQFVLKVVLSILKDGALVPQHLPRGSQFVLLDGQRALKRLLQRFHLFSGTIQAVDQLLHLSAAHISSIRA